MNLGASARAWVRRVVYELALHKKRMQRPKRRPCVVIFPSNQPWDAASNLRAWLVGPELERLGWRVVIVPEPLSLRQRRRIVWLERPDVILLQQTRHFLNQPHLYHPVPCVLDADDADILDTRHHDRIAAAARIAAAVIGGSRFVAERLGEFNENSHVLWTCTPRPTLAPLTSPRNRGPVVAWAHASPLGYRAEAEFVQRVMTEVCRRTRCSFWLFGTTEADAREWFVPIRSAGGDCVAIATLSYEAYLAKVSEAAVGLQPTLMQNEFNLGKSFGKLLAYLSGQVAVVASDAADHPCFFRSGETAFLCADVDEDWIAAIVQLLEDPGLRSRIALTAWEDFRSRLTTDVFAQLLDPLLRRAANFAGSCSA